MHIYIYNTLLNAKGCYTSCEKHKQRGISNKLTDAVYKYVPVTIILKLESFSSSA